MQGLTERRCRLIYVLAPDGSLGEYLGGNKPDLRSMRGTRA